jgi:hypothetical protein
MRGPRQDRRALFNYPAQPARKSKGHDMAQKPSELGATWWGKNLDDVAREVARLATICNVRILDPGIIERVLHSDESVCGTKNALAFKKLHEMLKMHYHVRDKSVGAIGQANTALLITDIVERLKSQVGDRLGGQGKT